MMKMGAFLTLVKNLKLLILKTKLNFMILKENVEVTPEEENVEVTPPLRRTISGRRVVTPGWRLTSSAHERKNIRRERKKKR